MKLSEAIELIILKLLSQIIASIFSRYNTGTTLIQPANIQAKNL